MTHAGHGGGVAAQGGHPAGTKHQDMYRRLLGMVVMSFAAMYALMYAMVNSFENVFNSWNQVYMAALMAASMVIIELVVMRPMYANRRMNAFILAGSVVVLLVSWMGIRRQIAIGDRQFLRSMIPHHAGAILMCQQATVSDPRILQLCKGIVESQASEIAQMKEMLNASR